MAEIRVDRGKPSREPARAGWGRVGSVVGWVLVGVWAAWWVVNIHRDTMWQGTRTWVPPLAFLAGDFKVHIEPVARSQALGVDPYTRTDHWAFALYPYPPMVGRVFGWVRRFDPATAATLWQVGIAACLTAGSVAAWRARGTLGLGRVPFSLVLAATVWCTPALFAMERGQADPLVLVPLVISGWLLVRGAARADLAAGAILGAAAWLKYYPGLLVVAPLALGRWRAVVAFAVVAAAIGAHDRAGFVRSIRNGQTTAHLMADKVRYVHPTKHSLVESWPALGVVHRSRWLRTVPGPVAALVLLVPALVLVAHRVGRCPDNGPLVVPLMLWILALSTFAMPYSLDYNLVALPLALLAVASRRDPWWVWVALAGFALYGQPWAVPMRGQTLLFVKLGTLYVAGACLVRRARERGANPVAAAGEAGYAQGIAGSGGRRAPTQTGGERSAGCRPTS